MPSPTSHPSAVLLEQSRAGIRTRMMIAILCIALVSIMLAACGTSTTTTATTPAPTPTAISTPQPAPTPVPSPKPAQAPTPIVTQAAVPTPIPAAIPTPMPVVNQGAPAILDLRPASMSILGHRDCQKNGAFICLARVLSGPGNQSNLHWTAFTNVPGNIAFSPSSGVLAPGQSVLVTITLPLNACTPGLFFFRGPVNTHTITWMC